MACVSKTFGPERGELQQVGLLFAARAFKSSLEYPNRSLIVGGPPDIRIRVMVFVHRINDNQLTNVHVYIFMGFKCQLKPQCSAARSCLVTTTVNQALDYARTSCEWCILFLLVQVSAVDRQDHRYLPLRPSRHARGEHCEGQSSHGQKNKDKNPA